MLLQDWEKHFNPPPEEEPDVADLGLFDVTVREEVKDDCRSDYRLALREERRLAYEEAKKYEEDEDGNPTKPVCMMECGKWQEWFTRVVSQVLHARALPQFTHVHALD